MYLPFARAASMMVWPSLALMYSPSIRMDIFCDKAVPPL
jgi:hypothetical protein